VPSVRVGTTRWLVATRYGQDPDHNGLAMEGEVGLGPWYTGTEIVAFPLDAPEQLSVLAGTPDGGMAANASWTDDGRVLYIASDGGSTTALLRLGVDLSGPGPAAVTGVEAVAVPSPFLLPVDPHQTGPSDATGRVAFSAWFPYAPDGGAPRWMRPLWMVPATGAASPAQVSLLGCPLCPDQGGCCSWASLGDVLGTNDAHFSHSGAEVVWMQQAPSVHFTAASGLAYPYRQVARPLDGGPQVDLEPAGTAPTTTNAYAEWSPDDQLLAFWSIEAVDGVAKQFVNLMRPDGSGRTRVPLPEVLSPQHVSFLDADHLVFNGTACALSAGCSCDVALLRP
jgi:WD40-like Beta Propeller Repeat